MFEIKGFAPRLYQSNILKTTMQKNTLVCLPTGTGKTKNAILLAVHRLNEHPNTKVLILSPTKPLSNQICEECKESTTIPPSQINLLTGMINPLERKKLWGVSKIVTATPQTIENDARNNLISLNDVSLLVIDECHRSREKYANTIVASQYRLQSQYPRVLALTASPGATREKINEICKNLGIEDIEIRTEQDDDIQSYIQEKNVQYVQLDLPKELLEIRELIKKVYDEKISLLVKFGINKPKKLINRKDLLTAQQRFQKEIRRGNRAAYTAVSIVAQAIKLSYMLELVETQSANSLKLYMKKLNEETSKAAKIITSNKGIILAAKKLDANPLHPKLEKVKEIVAETLEKNKDAKIIIFANYRAAVDEIKNVISKIPNAKPTELVGQKLGFSQKEQLRTIERFNDNVFNVLIGTSITEEGISIGSLDLAVFYDHTGSEIRKIQRSGRVARIKPGKIIYLVTKGTRDEALLWSSHNKEKKMHRLLKSMKESIDRQARLA